MSRSILLAGLVLMLASPAMAGSPPRIAPVTPSEVSDACSAAGETAEAFEGGGLSGCSNTQTGGAIACDAGGRCKDFFADPRYTAIRKLIDANRTEPQQKL